ncbi:Peroxidase [Parasponia andersonii]|uniref:peroxidase n=1 Tax=Parasponia andersonii TaxID=3476 RepID=A0A2P5B236_PARAD|nr:Peroxidase [Parasponia andersonii]
MNPSMFFAVFLLGIQLVLVSSAYYEPATYSREQQEVPASSYNNIYVPKEQGEVPTTSSYTNYVPKEQQEFPPSSYYRNDYPKDHNDDQDSPHDDHDQILEGVFTLTVPTFLSEYHAKKPSEDDHYSLSSYHYYQSCPEFEYIVSSKVKEWVGKDKTLAAALLRLHFHDCAVRGCDASILLNHEGSERTASPSRTLRGFEVIDDIKSELEKKCPREVSCADVLTAAARDATVEAGGQYWTVDYGRKDGLVSDAKEAESLVPMGRESITDLIEFFQSLGLEVDDLVALSGAHTIGKSSCESIQYRLFNYSETESLDSTINPKYADYLQRKCRWATDNYVELDAETPTKFDNEYFVNLIFRKTGLLSTDQLLYSDQRTSNIVKTLATNDRSNTFYQQFKKSMKNLGNVRVLTGPNKGEIRANCNFVNPRY